MLRRVWALMKLRPGGVNFFRILFDASTDTSDKKPALRPAVSVYGACLLRCRFPRSVQNYRLESTNIFVFVTKTWVGNISNPIRPVD